MTAVFIIAACAAPAGTPQAPPPALVRLSPSDYPDLLDESGPAPLAHSVGRSLDYFYKLPPETQFIYGEDRYSASGIAGSLSALREFLLSGPSPDALKEYIKEHFNVYVSAGSDGRGTVLFTGYYTPELAANAGPDEVFRFPLYALPDDIVTADLGLFREKFKGERLAGMVKDGRFVPYYTRSEIDGGRALTGRGLELAWCADPVEVFFMQVQGSGVLVYPDGTRLHVNYAGANGRPYRSIGRLLVEQGKAKLEEMSLDFLKKYILEHPDEAQALLDYNESYVFFTLDNEGPYGSLSEPVTPGRTIAADAAIFPPGSLAYIETEAPAPLSNRSIVGWEPYRRFVMDQDTGGAIKGPGRADIYFGSGGDARFKAGYMRREGRLYFLVGKKMD